MSSHPVILRKDALENWPRVSAKRIADVLIKVKDGEYRFDELERFFMQPRPEDPSEGANEGAGD
jgi:hypothetical protein